MSTNFIKNAYDNPELSIVKTHWDKYKNEIYKNFPELNDNQIEDKTSAKGLPNPFAQKAVETAKVVTKNVSDGLNEMANNAINTVEPKQPRRGYEDFGIKDPKESQEEDYFPGSKTLNKYM